MDKNDLVYREHSAQEHLFLAAMILLVFFILTSSYNSEILPSGSLTGAAVVTTFVPIAVWGIIMLLIIGIIIGIVLWWKNHKKIQVQRAMQQDVESILKAAVKSPKPIIAVDPLTRKLAQVEQELVDIPIRSAAKGHILQAVPSSYPKTIVKLRPALHYLFHPKPKMRVLQKSAPSHKRLRKESHKGKHRESFQEKILQIQKEIGKVKTRE